MKRIIFALVISALLSACASTPRGAQQAAYIAACPQGSSTIKKWTPGPFGQFPRLSTVAMAVPESYYSHAYSVRYCTSAETEISSACRPTGGPSVDCLPAGTNTILVSVAWGFISATEWVIVSLRPGRLYEVRALYDSAVFQVAIVDVDVDSEKTVYEFSLPRWSKAQHDKPRDLTDSTQQ
jgi:hypothetical protein